MKCVTIITIITALSLNCNCQNRKIVTPYYVLKFQVVKERNKDSILVDFAFENTSNKSVFILDSFTAKWDTFKRDLEIIFGEMFINSRDSSQALIEVIPGATKVFIQSIPNHLNDSMKVQLLGGFVNAQNPGIKEKYVRRDFSRWEDYRNLSYTFLTYCY